MRTPQFTSMNNGKRQIIQLLNRNVVANVTMMRVVQIACYVASVVVLAFSIWSLTHSELTGAQVVFGLLLASCGPLVFLGMGLVLPAVTAAQDSQEE